MYTNKAEKNMKKYNVLMNGGFEILDLLPNEQIKHCIDNSKDGYYEDGWIITDKGRIWSLTEKRWLIPWMNENGYWRIANAYVHRWVCHYFMSDEDKRVLKMVEKLNQTCAEEDKWIAEVHHKENIEKVDCNNMTDEERICACMEVNNKRNLVYQTKKDHSDVHRIMNGKETKGEEIGTEEFDVFPSIMRNSGVENVYVSYNEDGKKEYNMTLKLKGMTPEEKYVYDKMPFGGKYYFSDGVLAIIDELPENNIYKKILTDIEKDRFDGVITEEQAMHRLCNLESLYKMEIRREFVD